MELRLNLGCGPIQPEGWVNVDGSLRARLASKHPLIDGFLRRIGVFGPTEFSPRTYTTNLTKRLPWTDASVDCIYSGELWEHFEYADAVKLTCECYRVLKPGGVIRLTVPDSAAFWQAYMEEFARQKAMPESEWDDAILRKRMQIFFNDIASKHRDFLSLGHKHKWFFDEIQLVLLLKRAGFVDVERRAFRDSRIPNVEAVETARELTVEAVKP